MKLSRLFRREAQRTVRPRSGAAPARSVAYSSSPLLASKTPPWRSKFVVALLALSFLVLLGRALYVQVLGKDFFQKQGEIRFARTLDLPASRGRILDRNGQILALSVPSPSIWVIPKDFEADRAQRRQLARVLGMTPAELDDRLERHPNFVWLRRQVEEQVGKEVAALRLKGVHQVREYKRKYPEGEAAAHVVGSTNADERGQEGVEFAHESELAGTDGRRRVIKDRLGRVVEDIGDSVAPVDGRDLRLTIDSKIQFFAYQRVRDAVTEHRARSGSVVVLDVHSGGVLAMANYPSFVPGVPGVTKASARRNLALVDTAEPGSTMKPFIAALALDSGRFRAGDVINTFPGKLYVTGLPITDEHSLPAMTVEQIVQKSSNVGTAKMALQMPAHEIWDLYSRVGFGQKPQIDFPGRVTGKLRSHQAWRPIDHATIGFGYGVSVSLMQLAQAYTVFARDGDMVPLSLVLPPDGDPVDPLVRQQVVSAQTARAVRKMLAMVTQPGGTALKAQVPGYSVAGKTGTSRKWLDKEKRYAQDRHRGWFVGMAPADRPRIVVAVMIDEPRAGKFFGGDVAAPVFSQVVQQTLRSMGVQPDLDVKSQIVANDLPSVQESY
ncbi:penicillin-binding protein 2 [uncultured Piscinibacter sp.]|uniref:peptidoglycan D,D-transpeptidase FtsI family protein n=1 Tax=uncultured Piscinibacter sp. TaxID=1131835 RepID=UPI0026251501|nr:penicillin-binding protein 2 [uncultured Piscinibacter sp.]